MHIIQRPVKRIFTFGCSFTQYYWSCWPEIIAKDLNIPLYNYGKSGAGNQYIANAISQADYFHKFTQDDLIVVSWTSVCREDRWRRGDWVNTGNIFTQSFFDEKFLKEWADPLGYMIRDLSTIKFVQEFLESKKCQYHMLSMCDIDEQIDQCDHYSIEKNSKYFLLQKMYRTQLDSIMPSFFRVLWNNDIYQNKILKERDLYGKKFSDGHPRPTEHLKFLENIFYSHKFSKDTVQSVINADEKLITYIKDQIAKSNKPIAIYEIESPEKFKKLTEIYSSLPVEVL